MSKRKQYSPEFKREAVELARRSGTSCRQIAQEIGVAPSLLNRWVREARAAEKPFPGTGNPRDEELARLKRELARVTKERDFLKDAAIQQHATKHGYSIVREYCGHGIGREMHEEPQVLHFGRKGSGVLLQEGMTFTIEPMINQGKAKVKLKKDGWTVVTSNKKLSAQWEHTIAVTATGYEVLTLREEEQAET